jgi:hypothetical protein
MQTSTSRENTHWNAWTQQERGRRSSLMCTAVLATCVFTGMKQQIAPLNFRSSTSLHFEAIKFQFLSIFNHHHHLSRYGDCGI